LTLARGPSELAAPLAFGSCGRSEHSRGHSLSVPVAAEAHWQGALPLAVTMPGASESGFRPAGGCGGAAALPAQQLRPLPQEDLEGRDRSTVEYPAYQRNLKLPVESDKGCYSCRLGPGTECALIMRAHRGFWKARLKIRSTRNGRRHSPKWGPPELDLAHRA
jgi:hypothetical protein